MSVRPASQPASQPALRLRSDADQNITAQIHQIPASSSLLQIGANSNVVVVTTTPPAAANSNLESGLGLPPAADDLKPSNRPPNITRIQTSIYLLFPQLHKNQYCSYQIETNSQFRHHHLTAPPFLFPSKQGCFN